MRFFRTKPSAPKRPRCSAFPHGPDGPQCEKRAEVKILLELEIRGEMKISSVPMCLIHAEEIRELTEQLKRGEVRAQMIDQDGEKIGDVDIHLPPSE